MSRVAGDFLTTLTIMFRKTLPRMARPSNDYVGATGSLYRLKHIIQERPYVGRVWLAMSGPKVLLAANRR